MLRVIGTSRWEEDGTAEAGAPGGHGAAAGPDGPTGGAASVEAAQAHVQWQAVVPLSVNVLPDCGTNCQS
ncbi:hypothetical protein Ssi03_30980 [Sphaerisporangium siamense]|nr:hypothetical protein Ssi03_30980 [Sphaerisporangium siamense]